MNEKIAIIGGGIAGLTAAYLLNDKHDITLFEKDNRIGGNMYTLNTRDGDELDVSIFFFSTETYPNFFKLLDKLGLEINTPPLAGASMTMMNLDNKQTLYFNFDPSKRSLKQFSLKKMAINVSVLVNIKRAMRLLEDGKFEGLTMEQAMKLLPKLKGEASKLILFPLCLMASMHYHELMQAPATYFMGKLQHHFGSIKKAMSWRLINYRTNDYIEALAKSYRDKIVLNSDVKSIGRTDNKVVLKRSDGSESNFDKIVFACNADQALKLLEQPTDEEKRILGVWRYNDGPVVVHKDTTHFPQKDLWAMYEYLYTEREEGEIITSINASYAYQKGVSDDCEYLGTQNPNFPINEDLIEFQKVFRTPIYDEGSVPMIKELPSLNGTMNSYYCGSHFGYGLQEDAVVSAIEVAKKLGVMWD